MVSTRGKVVNYAQAGLFEDDEEDDVEERPSKKQKAAWKDKDRSYGPGRSPADFKPKKSRFKRPSGKLKTLMSMPIDIFMEICGHLDPKSLWNLSLTTKHIRGIVMSRKARPIWQNVLSEVPELPDCPDDMTEPEFVRLLFSHDCYGTNCQSRGELVDFWNRVRFCSNCFDSNLLEPHEFDYDALPDHIRFHIYGNDVPCDARTARYKHRGRRIVLRSMLEAVETEYQAVAKDPGALVQFVDSLEARGKQRTRVGKEMYYWNRERLALRQDEIDTIKDARFDEVRKRLLALGWEDKDLPSCKPEFLRLARKPQRMTDQIWLNVLPKMIPVLESYKLERLEREKVIRRNTRANSLLNLYRALGRKLLKIESIDSSVSFPPIYEFSSIPQIKELIDEDTEEIIDNIWSTISEFARDFILKRHQRVLRILISILDGDTSLPTSFRLVKTPMSAPTQESLMTNTSEAILAPGDQLEPTADAEFIALAEHRLRLAKTTFKCKTCPQKQFMSYPSLLHHVQQNHNCNPACLAPLDEQEQTLLNMMLTNLSHDPETLTREEIGQDDHVVCSRCDDRITRRLPFYDMVAHFARHQAWFDKATAAVQADWRTCYPHLSAPSLIPELRDDHDWMADDTPLCRRIDGDQADELKAVQVAFKLIERSDPINDSQGEGLNDHYYSSRRIDRHCKLCPDGFSPEAGLAGMLSIHIQAKRVSPLFRQADTANLLAFN